MGHAGALGIGQRANLKGLMKNWNTKNCRKYGYERQNLDPYNNWKEDLFISNYFVFCCLSIKHNFILQICDSN